MYLLRSKDQIRSNQIKSDQIRSNQINSDQIRSVSEYKNELGYVPSFEE